MKAQQGTANFIRIAHNLPFPMDGCRPYGEASSGSSKLEHSRSHGPFARPEDANPYRIRYAPAEMRAIWITKHGGPKVLAVRETAAPDPAPNEVRIRVRASGLNFSDLMARLGLYPDAPPPPCVVGYEASGVVDATGSGTTGFRAGDHVLAITQFGGHADTLCVPVSQVRRMPTGMSFEDGAALPVAYLTAHHMLFRVAGLRPGMSVLVHGAGGGVGIALLQLCRTVEGITLLGTASTAKHQLLREQGCDFPIDYRTTDYVAEVLERTNGRGVDLVLDPLGGIDWRRGYRLLRPAGMLVAYGFSNLAQGPRRSILQIIKGLWSVPKFSPVHLMAKNRAVAGVNMGHLWNELEMLGPQIDALLGHYQAGKIRPHIDARFSFEQAIAAHQYVHDRKNVGKVLLVP